MSFSEQFWWSAVFAVIGGVITMLFIKVLENMETARSERIGGRSAKEPQEHDERLC